MQTRVPTERSFGLMFSAVCAGVGAYGWWRGDRSITAVFLIAAVLLTSAGVFVPTILRAPNRLWWRFAQALSRISTRLILTLVFIFVITPFGFVMKLFGRRFRRSVGTATNWSVYATRRKDPKHFERLF